MRALIQRVSRAEVRVADQVVGACGPGFLILLGVKPDDTEELALKLAKKIAKLRVFEDDAGKMNLDIASVAGECLVVSQFTLYGSVKDGNRPGFSYAARPEVAEPLYDRFCAHLRELGVPVATGSFGAMMEVELVNDGPTTIWLDSEELYS